LTPEDWTDMLSWNVGNNYHYSLRNMAKERSFHLHRSGGMKSRRWLVFVNWAMYLRIPWISENSPLSEELYHFKKDSAPLS
jgi:hypothetical protein